MHDSGTPLLCSAHSYLNRKFPLLITAISIFGAVFQQIELKLTKKTLDN